MEEDNYFKNLSDRERAIFEGGISMGALFHQFVGTPISIDTTESLEKAIRESILLQPAIIDVEVKLDKDLIEKNSGVMGYTSLTGEMLSVRLTTKVNEKTIITCISYDEKLNYPIMYIEE
ncbi:MAG: dihydroneopterin aldolase [Methanosphaera sp. rholeuAM270]|nr:MAG: dihydroneopterin aldolase [Methanosphaera sp. rholeuAM270]